MIRKFFLTLLLIAGWSNTLIKAQQLFVWQKDGTSPVFNLSAIQTVKFSSGNLLINETSGYSNSYSLASVRKLTFDKSTGIESIIYKNPANIISIYYCTTENSLHIYNGSAKIAPVLIYQKNSVMAMHTQVSPGTQSIDVSKLAHGFYIVKVNNKVLKFIK